MCVCVCVCIYIYIKYTCVCVCEAGKVDQLAKSSSIKYTCL